MCENNVKIVNNVEDLINSNFNIGDIVKTLGYYKKGDGGGYIYEIVNDEKLQTEVVNISLANGLKAKYGLGLKYYDMNVLTIGIKRGDKTALENNSLILEKTIAKYNRISKFYFPAGETFYISNIHFTNLENKNISIDKIIMYGDIGVVNGDKMSKINTLGGDFICDKRGIDEKNPIVKSMMLVLDDLLISSTTYLEGRIPSGICFGQDIDTPLKQQEINFRFNNVNIMGFDYGIYSPHWSCGGSGGDNAIFSLCHCGIYVGYSMHRFNARNFSFNDCAIGIDTGWGGRFARLENTHISTGYLGKDKETFNEYIGILTRCGVTLDGIYYEPYNNNGYMDRCVLIKHEGYAYGIGPLYIKNTPISHPGSGNRGIFLKSDCYVGWGFSRGNNSPNKISSWDIGHYPNGAVIFENCPRPRYEETLKSLIKINSSKSTNDYKYCNVWWGYDFDGWYYNSPNLLVGKNPFIKGKGSIIPNYQNGIFREISFDLLSEVNNMYKETEFPSGFKRNVLYPDFVIASSINEYTFKFKINLEINGIFSPTSDVTIGIFARKNYDNKTLRLIKKIETIKPNSVYDEYEKYIEYEINPSYDLLEGENKIYFGYISNTGYKDNLLTKNDNKNIIYDFTIERKKTIGTK